MYVEEEVWLRLCRVRLYCVKPQGEVACASELCKVCFEMNAVRLTTVEQHDSSE